MSCGIIVINEAIADCPPGRYNAATDAVPPSHNYDIVVLASEAWSAFAERAKRWDFIIVYSSIFAVDILFVASYLSGIYSNWYAGIKQSAVNPIFAQTAWVLATLLSYIGLYILWLGSTPEQISRNLAVSVWYLVGSLITLAWSVALYQANDIGLAVWLSAILFVFQFWVFILVWYIKPIAAIFLIPLVLMYGYLVYSMIHLAWINSVPL